jgi:hypothetical protein
MSTANDRLSYVHKPGNSHARAVLAFVLGALLMAVCAGRVAARDAFVLLSGGDSEMDNNYSQYLQAKAMAGFFDRNYPPDSVWTFFGAGNVAGAKPVFSDVYRQVKHGDDLVDTWLPGALPHNRPATREEFIPALRTEILPLVASGGTLYLFVGDHGSQSGGRHPESIIVLWGVYRDDLSEHGWSESDEESLGVTELRHILASGIGKGRVVFCMTQCHAGGFHYLAMPHDMTPEASWFITVPAWARRVPPTLFPRAAGFAATDEYSLASGCNPSPDPEVWEGYERYLPESLLGVNLFTSERTGDGLRSFAEAHAAACLVDQTIDKPRSTSEQYLERWATLIENRLAREPRLTPAIKAAVANYQLAVNGQMPRIADPAFQEHELQFRRVIEKLAAKNDAGVLLTGSRADLEAFIQKQSTIVSRDAASASAPAKPGRHDERLWTQTVRPAWQAAVQAGRDGVVPADAVRFEKFLLEQEDRGTDYFFSDGDDLRNDVFWQAGYGNPQTLNPARAEAISLWSQVRDEKILDWAKTGNDKAVRNAAARLEQIVLGPDPNPDTTDADDKAEVKVAAAQRTLFCRRVLAAWQFLIAVNDRPALVRLRELIELERTPLPRLK